MQPTQRVVTHLPLLSLWDDCGMLKIEKQREVGREQIADLLRRGPVRFVVANCGDSLKWVPAVDSYQFWKLEVKPRLLEPSHSEMGFRPEDFPGGTCYVGTEWGEQEQMPVVLLEMYH